MRKVFLDNLPRDRRNMIDWKNSINLEVDFIFDDIQGKIKLLNIEGKYLTLQYKDKIDVRSTGNFTKCKISKLVRKNAHETNPEIEEYLVDKNDAYRMTKSSHEMVWCNCIICGYKKKMQMNNLTTYGFFCPICSDHISFPEKFFMNFLDQLHIDYVFQLTSSYFKWVGSYRYDFYLPKYDCIIEIHGEQHYVDKKTLGRSFAEEQENDINKENLAKENNISKYIIINAKDCSKLFYDTFIENIKNEMFFKKFDLDFVNWNECASFGMSSLVYKVINLYNEKLNNNEYISTTMLSEYFHISAKTIQEYLKIGSKHGLCNYDAKIAKSNASKNSKRRKHIGLYKNDVLIDEYPSIIDLCRVSKEKYGMKFSDCMISQRCDKDILYHGFFIKSM